MWQKETTAARFVGRRRLVSLAPRRVAGEIARVDQANEFSGPVSGLPGNNVDVGRVDPDIDQITVRHGSQLVHG